jgi:hypothetical protein
VSSAVVLGQPDGDGESRPGWTHDKTSELRLVPGEPRRPRERRTEAVTEPTVTVAAGRLRAESQPIRPATSDSLRAHGDDVTIFGHESHRDGHGHGHSP